MTATVSMRDVVAELELFHAACDGECKVRYIIAAYREVARANESLQADNLRLIALASAPRRPATDSTLTRPAGPPAVARDGSVAGPSTSAPAVEREGLRERATTGGAA